MLFRTSFLLAIACAACSAPRPDSTAEVPAQPERDPPPVQIEKPADEPDTAPSSLTADAANPRASEPAVTNEPAAVPSQPPAQGGISDVERELRARCVRAVNDGNYQEAIRLLVDWTTAPLLAQARFLLDRGRAEEALVLTTQATTNAPGDARAALFDGEANLRVGLRTGDRTRLENAQRAFGKAGATPAALLGASHAARELERVDEALRLAREGWAALQVPGSTDDDPPPCELPELTIAHALVDACAQERRVVNASTPSEGTAPAAVDPQLLAETEAALARLVQRAPNLAWGWQNLGELYESTDRIDDAQRTLERGADALPNDVPIGVALARVAKQSGGNGAVIAVFERLQRAHPDVALPWWFAGRARFDELIAAYTASPSQCAAQSDAFRAVENEFEMCARLGGTQLGNALQYQAQCRSALGVCLLQADKLEDALSTFHSIEALYPGPMSSELASVLPSGLRGIELVAEAYRRRDDMPRAADLYVELHTREPRRLEWAISAGAVNRDACEQLEDVAKNCQLAYQGKITDARRIQELRERVKIKPEITGDSALRDAFRRQGEARLNKAKRHCETSYQCYVDAGKLAPDEVRVLADCAAVVVDHMDSDDVETRRRIDDAQARLQRGITLGKAQLESTTLSDDQRVSLRQAVADAHQTLGVLLLTRRKDPARAKKAFESSVEISPSPRPRIKDKWLPECEKALLSK